MEPAHLLILIAFLILELVSDYFSSLESCI
jgi:hypothetical protein